MILHFVLLGIQSLQISQQTLILVRITTTTVKLYGIQAIRSWLINIIMINIIQIERKIK